MRAAGLAILVVLLGIGAVAEPALAGGSSVDVRIGLEEGMALDAWRGGGCGYDSTNGQVYITQTRNARGQVTPVYSAPISLRRLFAPRPRVLRLRATHPFTVGSPNQAGGGYTEVRTVEVTIRKLRRR